MVKYNIAINMGCTNTKILKAGVGVVLNEPTLLLFDGSSKKNPIKAVGEEVVPMSKKCSNAQILCPIKNDVIVNKEFAKIMLGKFLEKLNEHKFFRGNLLWLVPTSLSQMDKNEYVNLGYSLGFKNVDVLPSAIAGFQELEIDVENKHAHVLVDIGGETTDVSVVLRGRIIQGCTANLGGKDVDENIENLLKNTFNMNINSMYATKIKNSVNSMIPNDELGCEIVISDEDGTNNELTISARELRNIYVDFFLKVCDCIGKVINMCPSEIVSDINKTGIYLCGGMAKVAGVDKFMRNKLGVPVYVVERPEFTTILGCEKLLNEPEKLTKLIDMN